MKSKGYMIFGMLTLGVAICVSSMTPAQQPGGGPVTRVALVNLAQVFKNYSKVVAFAADNKNMLQPYSDKAKTIQVQIEVHQKELEKKDLAADLRAQYERNLKTYQRQMEDLSTEAKGIYTKKNEEQMLIVYKEVMDATERYALAHGYELVMHFNDVPKDQPEYYNPVNVSRKIQAGACIPMFMARGIEITQNVVAVLNDGYKSQQPPPPH